ncbi:cytosine deaminase [Acetobacteraceae bacterium H6797]|nr:cytosine deaminase [Acetobacteraceae bacterium H6797]
MNKTAIPSAGGYWLRDARVMACLLDAPVGPVDGEGLCRVDLRIEARLIADIAPAGTAAEGIPLRGGQVWPCFVDGHTHLDKGHIWPRSANPDGSFKGALETVAADRDRHWAALDVAARFEFGLRCAWHHGTGAIRTHIDSEGARTSSSWEVFSRLREDWAGRVSLQAASIASLEIFTGEEGARLANLVARHGGVLGMVTTLQDGPVPDWFQPALERFFALAEERGLDIDLHVDESGASGARALREIALTALRRGFKGKIQCGHCCSLSMQPEDYARETIAACAEAGLSVVVLPMCNLYLQGRAPGRTPRWRGVTLVHELKAAGVPVSLASDNCRDPFYAYGDHDMVEVFRESVRILQLDHPFGDWARAVTAVPADVMGLSEMGRLRKGARADLVLFPARGMTELLARPQSDRIVLRAGRVQQSELPDYRELDAVLGLGA